MMKNLDEQFFCTVCGLEKQVRFCKYCKKETPNAYKKIILVNARARVTLSYKSTHEFYEKNDFLKWLLVVITVISPFIGIIIIGSWGFIAGAILSAVAYFVGPRAIMKVREIREGGA